MVHPKRVIMKLPENGCRTLGREHLDCWVVHMMPYPPPHIWAHPHDWSLQLLYLSTLFYNLFVHTFTNLQIRGLRSLHAPPSQRSSTSDSLVCTSTATSIGNPGSHGVGCLGNQPSAVASESDHGLSKVRHSSSSMAAPQSHDHRRLLGSGSPSSSPCSSSASVDGGLGSASSRCSSSSCSLSSSSNVEESVGQLTSQ